MRYNSGAAVKVLCLFDPCNVQWKPYSPPEVDRIWLWVYFNNIPIHPIFYLLKGAYKQFFRAAILTDETTVELYQILTQLYLGFPESIPFAWAQTLNA